MKLNWPARFPFMNFYVSLQREKNWTWDKCRHLLSSNFFHISIFFPNFPGPWSRLLKNRIQARKTPWHSVQLAYFEYWCTLVILMHTGGYAFYLWQTSKYFRSLDTQVPGWLIRSLLLKHVPNVRVHSLRKKNLRINFQQGSNSLLLESLFIPLPLELTPMHRYFFFPVKDSPFSLTKSCCDCFNQFSAL